MLRVHLVHWNPKEAEPLLTRLRRARHHVTCEDKPDSGLFRKLRDSPPDAIAIDLSRLPSHGREIAIGLRSTKSTRHIPIVFIGGEPAKVSAIREKLPDAVYAAPEDVESALNRAVANPPPSPVVPVNMTKRYSGRTTAQKLGIREGSSVALIDPPREYVKVLGALPAGAVLQEDAGRACDIALWFVHHAGEYQSALPTHGSLANRAKLWILWRKQKGAVKSEINENLIRDCALAAGLVDYKVCSVDPTWSGLLFARK